LLLSFLISLIAYYFSAQCKIVITESADQEGKDGVVKAHSTSQITKKNDKNTLENLFISSASNSNQSSANNSNNTSHSHINPLNGNDPSAAFSIETFTGILFYLLYRDL
jgi:hypothetical protein